MYFAVHKAVTESALDNFKPHMLADLCSSAHNRRLLPDPGSLCLVQVMRDRGTAMDGQKITSNPATIYTLQSKSNMILRGNTHSFISEMNTRSSCTWIAGKRTLLMSF